MTAAVKTVGRRRELVQRLLGRCERLIVGVYNEHEDEHTTEESLRLWGFVPAGSAVRRHRSRAGMEYRALWIDAG